ncbi:hypothetical protein PAXRUDRAFT_768936 [Paxillus rubicundulus Ve08.2h10]|uniref:Uncharacterized protein n=1 Tax=Paxillus rubicundulus Ve08.2h10 TaxID=930991 RepID=A0A0D0DME9_9AGAM|nr:hypothetical protein PAXRUDRAFT_768936 [Paxillus rubicundulus Ve08.2h10]
MYHRFHAELFPMTHPMSILPDINISAKMVCEVDQMSDILNSCNPTLVRYTRLSDSAILIAESGEVITWYLPAAERVWESLKNIKISLPQSTGVILCDE